jgi:phosphohistidine phosphatase
MLIYLLRHADAEASASSDAKRNLTDKGIVQAEQVGRFCKEHKIAPEQILTSPYARAKQTAHLVAKELGCPIEEAQFLASGMQPETALCELRDHWTISRDSIMLVGHEPDISHLIAHLTGASIYIRKASLTLIDTPSLRPGAGTVDFSIPVKLMRHLHDG